MMRTPVSARFTHPSPASPNLAASGLRPHLRLAIALFVISASILLVAPPAEARGSGDTLSLVLLDTTDGVPHWGQDVTFEVTTRAEEPFVSVRCYVDGSLVYDQWAGYFDWAWGDRTFSLISADWQGEGADCRARLVKWARNGRERVLARLPFYVYA